MRLEAFITDLLYEHDCVIVPGFGGLVANYRAARLNQRTHLISPPSKHIGFNRNLMSNDGLLVQHVAGLAGISYREALEDIEKAVTAYQEALMNEGRLVWEKIGIFFRDKSGQIQFIPEDQENFLLSSFGLSSIQLKNVQPHTATDETPIIPIEKARRQNPGGWKIAAAIALPLLVGGSLLLRNQLVSTGRLNLATLNPFDTARVISAYESRPQESTLDIATFPTLEPDTASPAENGTSSTPTETSELPVVNRADATPEKHKSHSSLRGKYAVIGGAFKVKQNANKFLKKLKDDGFDAQFAGTRDGMTLVAYGIYETSAEAQTALDNLRATDGVNAWVRHN